MDNYLFLEGVEVVVVDVRVAQRVHELPGGEPRHVGDHVSEKGVAASEVSLEISEIQMYSWVMQKLSRNAVPSDVEGDSEPHVRRSLVQLAREFAVCDVELEWRSA